MIYHLLVCTDKKFAKNSVISSHSAFDNLPRQEKKILHVMVPDFEQVDEFQWLEQKFPNTQVIIYPITYVFVKEFLGRNEFAINVYHKSPQYYRLMFPYLVKNSDIKTVLYFDGDVIFWKDFHKLFHLDMGEHVIAATEDVYEVNGYDALVKQYNLDGYINSGLLLMDLGNWRKYHADDANKEHILRGADEGFIYVDQDIFNLALNKRTLKLSSYWNYINILNRKWYLKQIVHKHWRCNDYKKAHMDHAIIHFAGAPKPWNFFSVHPRKYYWYYYALKSGQYTLKELFRFFFSYLALNPLTISFLRILGRNQYTRKLFIYCGKKALGKKFCLPAGF